MLLQLHHDDQQGNYSFKAQSEFIEDETKTNDDLGKFIRDWIADVETRHPLPEGHIWMICNQDSEHFMWAATAGGDQ